jgi:hypothetical protein
MLFFGLKGANAPLPAGDSRPKRYKKPPATAHMAAAARVVNGMSVTKSPYILFCLATTSKKAVKGNLQIKHTPTLFIKPISK